MGNKKSVLVGQIQKYIISFYSLDKYKNFNIYLSLNLKYHTNKHMSDFISDYSYYYTLKNVKDILLNPEFIYYDYNKNSLKYFKKIKEYVCAVVKFDNERAFVATFYPVNKNKILKLKKLLILDNIMIQY